MKKNYFQKNMSDVQHVFVKKKPRPHCLKSCVPQALFVEVLQNFCSNIIDTDNKIDLFYV